MIRFTLLLSLLFTCSTALAVNNDFLGSDDPVFVSQVSVGLDDSPQRIQPAPVKPVSPPPDPPIDVVVPQPRAGDHLCEICDGAGKLTCPHCQGELQCLHCNGTGRHADHAAPAPLVTRMYSGDCSSGSCGSGGYSYSQPRRGGYGMLGLRSRPGFLGRIFGRRR